LAFGLLAVALTAAQTLFSESLLCGLTLALLQPCQKNAFQGTPMRTFLSAATLAVTVVLATPIYAQNCHHDPVCQAKRDGVSVAESKRRDRCMGGLPADQHPDRAAKCGIQIRR
jgi:hypothetical protein